MFEIINEQQLLDMCLYTVSSLEGQDEENSAFKTAFDLITAYAVKELDSKGLPYSVDDIKNEINELVTQYSINNLIRSGLVEASFEEDGSVKYGLAKEDDGK